MRPLAAHDLIAVWEWGQGQPDWNRALSLLTAACPESTREDLAALTIGQRDNCLLTLRELTFGPVLNAFATCPQCSEHLEWHMRIADLKIENACVEGDGTFAVNTAGLALQCRLPNSMDLAAVADCQDVATARWQLVQRCLMTSYCDGQPLPLDAVPAEAIAKMAEQMTESDPQAEVLLDLECPVCHHPWLLLFDIVSFIWAELSAQAKRLLRDVVLLSRACGWREADILAMSAFRRQCYLDMVT